MIATQSVQMVFSAVLAAIALLGQVQLWEVYAIAVLTGTALVFDAPSRQNLTFQMVGRDELPNAVALNSSLFNTARIFGPGARGSRHRRVGRRLGFAINTVSFLAVLAGLLAMRRSRAVPAARPPPADALARHTRRVRVRAAQSDGAVIMLDDGGVLRRSASTSTSLLPVLAKNTLDAGPRTFGIISACFGAGALVGALVGGQMATTRWRVMFIGAAGFGPASSCSRRCTSTALAGALLFVCGVFFTTYIGELERGDPAREPRLHPRPRARALLLRVERPGAVRRAARRLACATGAAPNWRSSSVGRAPSR